MSDGKWELCPDCDQPMLPDGMVKQPNEFDHASGCPRAESPAPQAQPQAEAAPKRVLPDAFYEPVSYDRARLSYKRYHDQQFRLPGERPRASIPANPDDDDLVLSRFIEQHKNCESPSREEELRRALDNLVTALHGRWAYDEQLAEATALLSRMKES